MDNNDAGDEFISSSLLSNENSFIIPSDDADVEEEILPADSENSNPDGTEEKREPPLREQDRFLPIANIAKIMKRAVPDTGKIAKDARECVQECVSEFISFITSEASERCQIEKRKTVTGEDVIFAMTALGFENYAEPIKQYLQKYREAVKGDKSMSNLLYEEVTGGVFSANVSTDTILPDQSVNQQENPVIYAYTDQIPHFNLV